MSDTYNPQPTRGPRFRGMRRSRVNPQTGQRETEVWVQGQGYLPEGSIATLAEEDQAQLSRARSLLGTARTNSRLANDFLARGRTTPTGGLSGLPVPGFMQSAGRQRLEGLTNNMVRANIQPGQAGTMNSIIEQMLARQQFPTTDTYGSVNSDRGVQMMVDEAEILAMVDEAERWAREHRGLQGFDVHWTRNRSSRVRQEAEREVRNRLRREEGRGQSGGSAAADITIDANGNRIQR